jgi:hypothetical protein
MTAQNRDVYAKNYPTQIGRYVGKKFYCVGIRIIRFTPKFRKLRSLATDRLTVDTTLTPMLNAR